MYARKKRLQLCVLCGVASSYILHLSELEFLKRLWGLGTGEEEGYRTGPPGYIGWRNSFLGIDSGAPYTFKNTSSVLGLIPLPGAVGPWWSQWRLSRGWRTGSWGWTTRQACPRRGGCEWSSSCNPRGSRTLCYAENGHSIFQTRSFTESLMYIFLVGWSVLATPCLCRPFKIFEGCMDSNPACFVAHVNN